MKRLVPFYEKKQRGCLYCKNMVTENFGQGLRTACPFEECPYTVLDNYKTYEEFMASKDSKILVDEFFSTVAAVYAFSMQKTPKKLFSEGDSRVHL